MQRLAMEQLVAWKENPRRKPMIIRGARQVGKTWLMREFGRGHYHQTVYINFDSNSAMEQLFAGDLTIERLRMGLELASGHKIDPATTLLIFDEVQEVPRALTSLKYFNENAPEYQIVCAGSLLGVAMHPGTSFPVGKVEYLDLYPMSFVEFLLGMGKESFLAALDSHDFALTNAFKANFIELLRQYYFVGGMPEAVDAFARDKDFAAVRQVQQAIVHAYEQDFSKHAPAEIVPRLRMLWSSVPAQLAKENKKFIYGLIKEGARAREFELALLWLQDCGLLYQVRRVSSPSLPLAAYQDLKAFKLFLLDVGLLSCLAGLPAETILYGNRIFTEFKGALTEQYVLQQLKATSKTGVYYWTNDRGSAEIDFLLDAGNQVIPLEVKAEQNLKAKSLQVFREKYQPELAIRTSLAEGSREDWLLNLPLYAVGQLDGYLIPRAGASTLNFNCSSPTFSVCSGQPF
jgi:hypothetical protein